MLSYEGYNWERHILMATSTHEVAVSQTDSGPFKDYCHHDNHRTVEEEKDINWLHRLKQAWLRAVNKFESRSVISSDHTRDLELFSQTIHEIHTNLQATSYVWNRFTHLNLLLVNYAFNYTKNRKIAAKQILSIICTYNKRRWKLSNRLGKAASDFSRPFNRHLLKVL